ncbi:MAG TPA: hypothetical protein PLM75_01660 [bacterium]|nr:hypothetical protein [bacterium]
MYITSGWHIIKALDVLNENNPNAAKNLITQAFNYLETALNMYYDDELTRFMIEKILLRIEAVNSPIRQKYSDFNNYLGLQFFYDYSKHLNALFSMQRAIRLDPQNINKRYELAKMYQRLNNVPAAIDEYNKILDIDNRNINAKDYRDLLKYDFDNKSELLKKYINQNATNKRLKILIKLQSDFSNILHSNFFEILEEYLINLSEYNFKFDFYFASRHLETLDLIEQFAKSINADGIINISLEQTDDNIKAKAQILNLTDIKDKPNFDIFRGRRSLDLKSAERTLIFSGKNKFLNTAVELYNFLDAFFPIIAKVNEIQKYNIIINVGYYQGLKKDDKIILINRTANEDKRLGDAKILDTVGHYALCELLDAKTANTLKIEDLAIIFK